MVICRNDAIEVFINGQPMGRLKDWTPSKGYIALSPTGMPVLYRNIEIMELPATRGTVVLRNPAAFDVLASSYRVDGERRELVREFELIEKGKHCGFVLESGEYEVRGMTLGGGPDTAWQQCVTVAGGEERSTVFAAVPPGDED